MKIYESQDVLKMEHITKSYQDGEDKNIVLSDVSFEVKSGEFVAIVGPSGSGKSTFLMIAGMLLTPDAGTVFIAGKNMSELKKREWTKARREHIGFIFQNHRLLLYLKTEEQLSLFQEKENKTKVDVKELLRELDAQKCSRQYPATMSGGEKQRVAIARAFVNNPDLILADEPTASLDAARGRQVVELIRSEVKRRNKAAVMVTHDERVLDLVDKIYRLEDGHLLDIPHPCEVPSELHWQGSENWFPKD